MVKYKFQVNLNFGERIVSACGLGPGGLPVVVYARSLGWIPRRLMRATGLPLQQLELCFQPED